jgi:hypothetical protein
LRRFSSSTARNIPSSRIIIAVVGLLCACALMGCDSSYPKERVDACLVELCKREYGVDVEVKIVGRTIGVYIPINELIDSTLSVNPRAIGKVDDVIMSVSRVALSTDADFIFYVLVAQDPVIPDLELVIIRYVEDVKRFLVTDISRNEYFDRMITEFKLTPQIQKERLIRELFAKLDLAVSDDVIDAYFRSGYIDTIGDIGYWNNTFFLKDITVGEFLARQTEERIRKLFLGSRRSARKDVGLIKGSYQQRIFDFTVEATVKPQAAGGKEITTKEIVTIIANVIGSYHFEDFTHVNLSYDRKQFMVSREDLHDVRRRKIKVEDIL